MRVISLGSGSKGNATLVEIDGKYVLIDDGFSLKETEKRLAICPSDICALILTHDHSDHLCGVADFAKKYDVDVHIPDRLIGLRRDYLAKVNTISHIDGTYNIGDISISQFRLPHDATYTVGYRIDALSDSVGIVTDLGAVRDSVYENLKGVNTVVLESNYDPLMLEKGPYPQNLKRRITSGLGHISNDMAGDLAVKLVKSGTTKVILAHVSQNNNIPELAYDVVGKKLAQNGLNPTLYFAEQSKVKAF